MIAENRKNLNHVLASGKGRIRPKARLIRTLGAELISSEIVAILELVRNCYDADAQKVEIRFRDPHHLEASTIEICDDGHGMSREILLGPWLEPATDHKSSAGKGDFSGERSPGGRRRLGSKGVGRFAAQRLGEHLLLRSRQARSSSVLEAEFDWKLLDGADRYLDELVIPWREILAERRHRRGTSLFIRRLRDAWTEERFERLRLALSRLLGPGLGDEFQIDLVINGAKEEIKPFIDAIPPMYSIEGTVAEDGLCVITYQDVTGSVEQWQRSVLYPLEDACGPFSFRINSWDLDREALDYFFKKTSMEIGLRDFRRAIRDHSGVSLYRDGFRILPYGEPDNDWLRLDRRRVNNPTLRLSNNQILGWVQLTADRNPLLQDQTNREGLVANAAYNHLQQAILELISYLEVRRFTARRGFGLGGRGVSPSAQIYKSQADEHLEGLVARLAERTDSAADILPVLREAMLRGAERTGTLLQQYLQIAGAGSLVPRVVAELMHPTQQALSEVGFLLSEVKVLDLPHEVKGDFLVSLEKLQRSVDRLAGRIEKVSLLVSEEPRLEGTRLAECIETIGDLFLQEFVRSGIDFYVTMEEDIRIVSSRSIIEQVVALLFDNAVYWLRKAGTPRRLSISVHGAGFIIELNGARLVRDLYDRLFDNAFPRDPNELSLVLARDLLRTINGSIKPLRTTRGLALEVLLHRD